MWTFLFENNLLSRDLDVNDYQKDMFYCPCTNIEIFLTSSVCRLTELAGQAPAVIEMLSKLSGNSSEFSSFLSMEPQLLYQSYSVQQFIITQLQHFNGLCLMQFYVRMVLSFLYFLGNYR